MIDLKIALAAGIAGFTISRSAPPRRRRLWVTLAVLALNHMIQANMRRRAGGAGRRDGLTRQG